jgi:FkbM family methyltransferase
VEKPCIEGTIIERIILWADRNYHNIGSTLVDNGEVNMLQKLRIHYDSGFIAIDVGANEGNYSDMLLSIFSSIRVYVFEIDPDLHSVLSKRFSAYSDSAVVMPFGLSDRSGDINVRRFEIGTEVTSIDPLPRSGSSEIKVCRVERAREVVEEIIARHGRINLLKIDTEGHDLPIIKDIFSRADKEIDIIQFEFGQVCIPRRILLSDFYDILGSSYEIGRVFRCGVRWQQYNAFTDERYMMGNYLAIRKELPELIERLRA